MKKESLTDKLEKWYMHGFFALMITIFLLGIIAGTVKADINGSELLEDPISTIFSPYINLLGSSFWLVPISIISAALYVKTKNITVVGAWLLGAGMLMSTANIFAGFPAVLDLYMFLVVIGIVSIIIGIIMERK